MRTAIGFLAWMCTIPLSAGGETIVPSGDAIRKILAERIDAKQQSVGIVVGVVDPSGRRVVMYGVPGKGASYPLSGDTIFEIGSVTKVFTALLLSSMAQSGEVALTDPIVKYFPKGLSAPEQGRQITLQDLATHTSGLPRLPGDLLPKDSSNPYADYTTEQLYQFVSKHKLTRDVGSKYEYSNLGAGLLGNLLAGRAGMEYEALLKSRVLTPLGMRSTTITLSPEMKERLASGHNEKLKPVPNWDLPALAGAGALRSTANDMLTFVAAHLGYSKSSLTQAMMAMLATRQSAGSPTLEIALGWHILKRGENEIVWHNGGTGGYRSFIGVSPKSRAGVVVLSNASNSVDDIGLRILDPNNDAMSSRKEVRVDPKLFDGYVGRYQLAPNFILSVTREGDRLFTQATGQPKIEIFAASDRVYFPKEIEAEITFGPEVEGRASQLVLRQGGMEMSAKRIEGEPTPPKKRQEVPVSAKVLEGYAGRYQLAPGVMLEVTVEGSQLLAQVTGQSKFPIYAESEREFFWKAVDAQVTFEQDDQGRTTQIVLHQGGRDIPGTRIE